MENDTVILVLRRPDLRPARGWVEARRKAAWAAAALASLTLSACATAGTALTIAGTLSAAGYSVEAYCNLTPDARAEVRRKLGLRTQIFSCSTDYP